MKSTLAVLIIEWCIFKGWTWNLIDSDDNHDPFEWIKKSESRGDVVRTEHNPDVLVIDTAGFRGAAAPYVEDADVVLLPVGYSEVDLPKVALFLSGITPERREHVWCIPTRLNPLGLSIEQKQARDKLIDYFQMFENHTQVALSEGKAGFSPADGRIPFRERLLDNNAVFEVDSVYKALTRPSIPECFFTVDPFEQISPVFSREKAKTFAKHQGYSRELMEKIFAREEL